MPEIEDITELGQLHAFIDEYCLLRRKLLENLHLINRDLELSREEIPLSVMAMISQHVEIAINVFDYYKDNFEGIEEEFWERINIQERMVYVLALSCFEYVSILYYQENKSRLGLIKYEGDEKQTLSLRDILKLSKEIHLINDDDYKSWKGVLELRNVIVHNNAISSINKTFIYPPIKPDKFEYPELELKFEKGIAVEGSLLLFLHLMNWAIDSIEKWITNIVTFDREDFLVATNSVYILGL